MNDCFFITGTSTDVGKTIVATAVLECANRSGLSTAAFKPVASGCIETKEGLRNEDALALQQASSCDQSYNEINPIALLPAIAPHIAMEEAGLKITAKQLAEHCRKKPPAADFVIIEGVGGWRVPINQFEDFSQLPVLLNIPVIMVVSMTLGCISHALLTREAIISDGVKLAGWVANITEEEMPRYQENLAILVDRIAEPLLGEIPYLGDNPDRHIAANYLDFSFLI